jgi:hypothetical protein
LTNEHADLDRQIAAKRNEWIQARTAELQGHGSAENTRRVNAELKALEDRKNQLASKEKAPELEKGQNREKNRMVRQLRMSRSR